ncbi:MAG: RluA family pseudouridine synthase [Mycoplasmataceae bacterium]|nr:RluA family pseudouridine synthase [Mycoplasmataceae bacterium]
MTKIKVSGLLERTRLDLYLVKHLKENRTTVGKLLDQKLVLVNDQLPGKAGLLIENGFIIEIENLSAKPTSLLPSKNKLKIVYEDNDLIVVDKPKHILVHPTTFNEGNTVVNILLKKIKIKEFKDSLRPGIVHRLDRDTTGLLVIAKNKKTCESLIAQISNKTLIRKYLALVHYNFVDQFLLIKVPIDRSKQNSLKMVVSDDSKAKPAQTEVTVLENYKNGSLIECRLLTGRTHQIRVHMAYIHHPVFNDELYGKYDGYKDYGQFLHAHSLSFIHPTSHKFLQFNSNPDKTFNNLKSKLKDAK